MLQSGVFHQYLTLFVWGTQMTSQNCTFLCAPMNPLETTVLQSCVAGILTNKSLQVLETICIDPDEFLESVEKTNPLHAHHFHINEGTGTKVGGN